MKSLVVKELSRLKGKVTPPGDKSIAHRSIIISAISPGKTTIKNFPVNKDCLYTLEAFKKLGIRVKGLPLKAPKSCANIVVFGKGLYGLKAPKGPIFAGGSGTTLRLILGVLAGQNFRVKLKADKSLSQRPMRRVTVPLRMMGAQIDGIRNTEYGIREEYPPITIKGGNLKAITYRMPVASAQAKSAILLAGLYAKGRTKVIQPVLTRDHTERMLRIFKADIKVKKNKIIIKGEKELLSPKRIYIPGDISSASFFIVLAAILPDAQMVIRNVGLNHLRLGIIRVLKRMGAEIEITANSKLSTLNFEPMGDLLVKSSSLRATRVRKEEIPSLIDELPILMVAACFAKGKTIFEGVQELHVKETDRIRSMSENLKGMGSRIKIIKSNKAEKIIIEGIKQLHGARVRSFGDHRTAMSMVIAGLKAKDKTIIDDVSCISKSFPDFLRILSTLIR